MEEKPPRIVNDIVPLIIESSDRWRCRDLVSLAQVSSVWLYPIRKLLYSHVILRSYSSACIFSHSLDANPVLVSLVKFLDICPISGSYTPQFAQCLGNLLNLQLETISFGGELAIRAERFLHLVGNPELVKRIHINGALLKENLCQVPSLEWDSDFADRFPALEELKLSHLELEIVSSWTPTEMQLSHLTLDAVQLLDGYISQAFPSVKHLKIFTTDAGEFEEQIRLVLANQKMEYLEYQVQCGSGVTLLDQSTAYPMLRELHMSGLCLEPETLNTLGECCPNLTEISALGRLLRLTADDWATFITRSCPALQEMRISLGTLVPPFVPWSDSVVKALEKLAASRDIEML
ncbi:hypothetical protein C8J56DRAFT_1041450 [Mycena floridula]|nr:hypothetical protein C8J56DRAFT_1041450 [Mycena floridula]